MKSSSYLPKGLFRLSFMGSVAFAVAIVACAPNFTATTAEIFSTPV